MILYDWPRSAAFGRVIPKTKIYGHSRASAALKTLFVHEVDRIVWSYKLSPDTVNLPATKQVTEIQVIRITTRREALDRKVLRTIDRAIPFPLVFELAHGDRIKMAAACKFRALRSQNVMNRAHDAMSDYFEGDWWSDNAPRMLLPLALNMAALYELLLVPLVDGQAAKLIFASAGGPGGAPLKPSPPESAGDPILLEERIARVGDIKARIREVKRIEARLGREEQFNKRVAINAELRVARRDLELITRSYPVSARTQP